MNKRWMTDAEKSGSPSAFVIDKDGMVAWIGHPMAMDKQLEKIAGGTWDLKAEAVAYKEQKARQKKMQALVAKVRQAQRSKDYKGVIAAVDAAVQEDAKLEPMLATTKFDA